MTVDRFTGAYLGLEGIRRVTSSVVDATVQWQRIEFSLAQATGSMDNARKEMDFLWRTSNRLGTSFADSAAEYARLSAAAKSTSVSMSDLHKLFIGMSDAATVLHLSGAQIYRSFYALQEIMSTGTVQLRNLSRQLGYDLPGALEIAARAIPRFHGSVQKLREAIKNGALSSEEFIKAFGGELVKEFGNMAKAASGSLIANINKLKNAIFALLAQQDGFPAMSSAIKELTRTLSDPGLKKSFDALIAAMARVANQAVRMTSAIVRGYQAIGKWIGMVQTASSAGADLGQRYADRLQRLVAMRDQLEQSLGVKQHGQIPQNPLPGQDVQIAQLKRYNAEIEKTQQLLNLWHKDQNKLTISITHAAGVQKQQTDVQKQQTDVIRGLTEARKKLIEQQKEFNAKLSATVDGLELEYQGYLKSKQAGEEAASNLRIQIALMQKKFQIGTMAYAQAKFELEMQQHITSAIDHQKSALAKQTEEAKSHLKDQERAWKKLGDSIQRDLSSAFDNVLTGAGSLWSTIKDGFYQLLSDIAAASLRGPIMAGIGGLFGVSGSGLGGALGTASVANSLSGGSLLGGIGSTLASGAVGLASSISGNLGTGLAVSLSHGIMTGIGGALSSGSIMGTIGAALPIVGPLAAIAGLSGLFSSVPKGVIAGNIGSNYGFSPIESHSAGGADMAPYRQQIMGTLIPSIQQVVSGMGGSMVAQYAGLKFRKGKLEGDITSPLGNFRQTVSSSDQQAVSDMLSRMVIYAAKSANLASVAGPLRAFLEGLSTQAIKGADSQTLQNIISMLQSLGPAAEKAAKELPSIAKAIRQFADTSASAKDLTAYTQALVSIGTNLIDPMQAYQQSQASLYQQYQDARGAVLRLTDSYDGSLQAAQNLAAATQQFGKAALAVTQQIQQAIGTIQSTTASNIEGIQTSVMSQQQKYDYYRSHARSEAAKLPNLTDPAKIQQAWQSAAQYAMQAWNTENAAQQKQDAKQFVDFLTHLQTEATQQLQALQQQISGEANANMPATVAAAVKQAIGEAMAAPSNAMNNASGAMDNASSAMNNASGSLDNAAGAVTHGFEVTQGK